MIAQIHVPLMTADGHADGYTLTLDDEGKWVCTEWPEVAESMTRLHAGTFQEWNGDIGAWQASDAAQRLGGTILYLR